MGLTDVALIQFAVDTLCHCNRRFSWLAAVQLSFNKPKQQTVNQETTATNANKFESFALLVFCSVKIDETAHESSRQQQDDVSR